MPDASLIVREYGDAAVMVTVASPDPGVRRARIAQVRTGLIAQRPPGVVDLVAGLESLLVTYDPLVVVPDQIPSQLEIGPVLGSHEPAAARIIDIPVVFDSHNGPDLDDVAAEQGCSVDEVVTSLCSVELRIELLAAAMAPMMSGVELDEPVSRQATPRTDVPPGSIMIAGAQAIIQPFPGPTGWKVIGRTPLTIVDIEHEPPIGFAIGDRMRLRRISEAEAEALVGIRLGDSLEGDA